MFHLAISSGNSFSVLVFDFLRNVLPFHTFGLTTNCLCKICAEVSFIHSFFSLNYTRKEGSVLFNDALNTFYLRLYGVGHMVKDHSDSERETRCRQDNTYNGLC